MYYRDFLYLLKISSLHLWLHFCWQFALLINHKVVDCIHPEHTHIYVWMCPHMRACARVRTPTHPHTHTHMCSNTNPRTHTHTHTHTLIWACAPNQKMYSGNLKHQIPLHLHIIAGTTIYVLYMDVHACVSVESLFSLNYGIPFILHSQTSFVPFSRVPKDSRCCLTTTLQLLMENQCTYISLIISPTCICLNLWPLCYPSCMIQTLTNAFYRIVVPWASVFCLVFLSLNHLSQILSLFFSSTLSLSVCLSLKQRTPHW